ncbi:MAG: hypothetical protein M1817_006107 [Caeruleum heppii]|nr:MAG: hypothetical protein M1817_006107 [Caeruleum heppii]
MPRFTRSQRGENPILADSTQTSSSSEAHAQHVPSTDRAPLATITANVEETPLAATEEKPTAQGAKKKNKNKNKKKAAKKNKKDGEAAQSAMSPQQEVFEDAIGVDLASAVKDACESLMQPVLEEVPQIAALDARSATPPSPAVCEARKESIKETVTPVEAVVLETEAHHHAEETTDLHEEKEDSFIQNIGSRTPMKPLAKPVELAITEPPIKGDDTVDPAVMKEEVVSDKTEIFPPLTDVSAEKESTTPTEDSFIDQIVSRSPAKSITRIEDSIHAIDALEDALEEVKQSLPKVADQESPVKTRGKAVSKVMAKKPIRSVGAKKAVPPKKTAPAVYASATGKRVVASSTGSQTDAKKTATTPAKTKPVPKSASKVTSKVTPKVTSGAAASPAKPTVAKRPITKPAVTKPTTASSPSKATPKAATPSTTQTGISNLKTRPRPSSLSLRAPPPVAKSTKPLTRPTFTLPGEAISAKLKAQREERLKREEAETKQKREFRARPVRKSEVVPAVKENVASRVRRGETLVGGGDGHDQKRKRTSTIPSTSTTTTTAKRLSTKPLVLRPRPSISKPSANPTNGTSTSSPKPTPQPHHTRDQKPLAQQERERREKEEQARRARAEAAERGRVASRKWAERKTKGGKGGVGA